ncbi:MAG: NAD-dependent epimerase/dehydratase family protein [Bacteroidales bacterium]|nr:NAD-dependent epimerase/dehydratase family protein [Bacteroidales bacterium]
MTNDQYTIVTGANGYLGSYICRELISRGQRVIALKYDHYASVVLDHDLIEYVRCDIREPVMPQIEPVVRGKQVGAVINAAALLGSSDYDRNYAVNAKGVENLIEFARQAGISRFIQISSVVVIKTFKGPYGETKLIGQQMVEGSGLDYTVFIPAMILGPEGLGINRILKNVFRFPFIVPLIGKGAETQHPVFVKDFARYIVVSARDRKAVNKVYQIAGDRVISFRDLIRLILRIKGSKRLFISVPASLARVLGRFFQLTQKVPLFTAEHVKGVLQDSNLDTEMIRADLGDSFTPLEAALKFTLEEIGSDWDSRLKPREEKVIRLRSQ